VDGAAGTAYSDEGRTVLWACVEGGVPTSGSCSRASRRLPGDPAMAKEKEGG
jgi:hypothetical protein